MVKISRTFTWLCLMALSAAVVACSTDAEPTVQSQPSATPESDVVRVTVTPVPIDTPTPTAAVTTQSEFTAEQLADPVFPDWLDPELSDEQPDDEVLFAAWQDYLTDTLIYFTSILEVPVSSHFCADGIIIDANGEIEEGFLWGVTRTAAMSSSDWGKVALTADVVAQGGRPFTFMTISREDGKLMQTSGASPVELKVERSPFCLELGSG